ncbi:MAG: D-aminoacyl-tRNA deacylase [Candidatus Cybelea sp.]
MRAVVQRVSRACVRVADRNVGEIGNGLLVLVSVGTDDDERDVRSMAEKLAELRIFPDAGGSMNHSLTDAGGALLLVSQFTLHGDVRRGRRPSFVAAAPPARARSLYELLGTTLASRGVQVAFGEFGAHMAVELVNDGPVTILVDTKRLF